MRGEDARVGFAELFYDLVFVFAVTQVSHFLLHHYDVKGALEATILFLAVWWVWIYTTWALNWLDPETLPVRLMLFVLMTAGLFLSMAIPEAFAERGLVFGLAFAAMQVGRTLFILYHAGPGSMLRVSHQRILVWLLAAAVFWVMGGLAQPEQRIFLWITALGVEFLAPAVGYPVPGLGRDMTSNWQVRGGHIAERCGLFVIICLGETLLVSGATFAEMEWDTAGLLAFLASILATVGMWWVYFHIGHKRGAHQIEHSGNPGAIARLSFTYLHIPIVAGVVLAAVGAERAIAHPDGAATLVEGMSVAGGVMLFLFGNGLFKWVSGGRWFPLSHIVGLSLCLLAFGLGPFTTLLVQSGALAAILIVVAIWEHWSLAGSRA